MGGFTVIFYQTTVNSVQQINYSVTQNIDVCSPGVDLLPDNVFVNMQSEGTSY